MKKQIFVVIGLTLLMIVYSACKQKSPQSPEPKIIVVIATFTSTSTYTQELDITIN